MFATGENALEHRSYLLWGTAPGGFVNNSCTAAIIDSMKIVFILILL